MLGTTDEAVPAGAALDGKRLLVVWLLGGVGPGCLWAALYAVAPVLAAECGPFATAFGYACAALSFLWLWPSVFRLSRFQPRVSDVTLGALAGYLCINVIVFVPAMPIAWRLGDTAVYSLDRRLVFLGSALIVPILEELIFRGVIFGSLLKRTSTVWAILITAGAATVVHLPPSRWSSVFVAQLIFCGIYLVRGRSLPASIAAHSVSNALLWWPNVIVAWYLLLHV